MPGDLTDTEDNIRHAVGGKLHNDLWIKRSESLYSPRQIAAYLLSIKFPVHFTEVDLALGRFPATLENLQLLTRLQLVTFPYENTQMHYSAAHAMDISADGLYQRLVVERRGSYCFGLNLLFFQMLRGLGYRTYSGAGRINVANDASSSPVYTAPLHMVIFVQPCGGTNVTYLVDVGCGGSGPARPILLSDAADNVVMGTTPTELHRLTRGARPEASLVRSYDAIIPEIVEWRLEVWHAKDHEVSCATPWKVVYSFSEQEYFHADFESANLAVYQKAEGLFWDNVICSKHFWLTEDDARDYTSTSDRYLGRISMLGAVIRRHAGSHSETVRTLSTEKERADALREFFGLELDVSDLEHIRGRTAALGS